MDKSPGVYEITIWTLHIMNPPRNIDAAIQVPETGNAYISYQQATGKM